MAPYDKKAHELAILRKVYPKKQYPNVTHSDKPDFLITDSSSSCFGVEVTEFWAETLFKQSRKLPPLKIKPGEKK